MSFLNQSKISLKAKPPEIRFTLILGGFFLCFYSLTDDIIERALARASTGGRSSLDFTEI